MAPNRHMQGRVSLQRFRLRQRKIGIVVKRTYAELIATTPCMFTHWPGYSAFIYDLPNLVKYGCRHISSVHRFHFKLKLYAYIVTFVSIRTNSLSNQSIFF